MKSIFFVLIQFIEKYYLARIEAYERGKNRNPIEDLFTDGLVARFD